MFRIIVNFTNSLCFLGHYCETYKFMNEEVIYTIFTESLVECGMLCYLDKKCNGIKFTENEEKRCTTMILVEPTSTNFGENLRIFEQC